MLSRMVATAVVASLVSPAPALAATGAPPDDQVVIESVQVNGAACRPGTVAVAISPDNEAFTITYSEYLAQAGGGAVPGADHQKCKLTVQLRVPSGFTYAIAQVDYRGFAELAAGASGMQRATYNFQGDPPKTYTEHPFAGPLSDYWQVTDRVDAAAQIFAPCGKVRKINIDTGLTVSAGSADPSLINVLGMDSTDAEFNTTYHFAWRQCA
jgi:Domain of unknown function (DUF4360)